MVVEPTSLEEEPPIEQQTAGKESILSGRDKLGSAEEKRPPQSKESAVAEETKVAASPIVE